MAKVNICNVEVLSNPAPFLSDLKFKITFECYEPLEDDLEWKLVYVSSAYNSERDQILESILVGPVPLGRHQFEFEASAPDPTRIPAEDVTGMTVILIQAFYHDAEFLRVGFYVNNDYHEHEELLAEPPAEPLLDKIQRRIIDSDPRVTKFPIDWGDGMTQPQQQAEEAHEENGGTTQTVAEQHEEEQAGVETLRCGGTELGEAAQLDDVIVAAVNANNNTHREDQKLQEKENFCHNAASSSLLTSTSSSLLQQEQLIDEAMKQKMDQIMKNREVSASTTNATATPISN